MLIRINHWQAGWTIVNDPVCRNWYLHGIIVPPQLLVC